MTPSDLDLLLAQASEGENLEFKTASSSFGKREVFRYAVALANEGGGLLLLGVSDSVPRRVVGTKAFRGGAMQDLRLYLHDRLRLHVVVSEVDHPEGRVVVINVPSRPAGSALNFEGAYLMRSGESLVPMTSDRLKAIFAETGEEWLGQAAIAGIDGATVVALLDTQVFFDRLELPYPSDRESVLDRLQGRGMIGRRGSQWTVTNLGATVLAKDLSDFPDYLQRNAPRVVIYEGNSKLVTRTERQFAGGIAAIFEELVSFVHAAAPQNRLVEDAIRREAKMFPVQALRELIANALVHQDFGVRGSATLIEMFDDRVEITNPGVPPISVDRFIDENRSRNESLTATLRLMGICEEKGSGVDKVVAAAEAYQLPAPEFLHSNMSTTAILFSHRTFRDMSRADRVRACYQHCALTYVTRSRMTNQSLRERFGLSASKTAQVSQIIAATRESDLIRLEASDSTSTRYAKYVPYWA